MADAISEREASELIAGILGDDGFEDSSQKTKDDTESKKNDDNHLELVEDVEDEDDTEDDELGDDDGELEDEDSSPAEDTEDDTEDADAETITTIDGLAAAFEVEPEDFMEAVEVMDIEGNPTNLKKIVDSWRAGLGAAEMLQAESIEQVAQIRADLTSQSDVELKKLAGVTQAMIHQFNADFKDVNWERLREDDPHAWADLRDKQAKTDQLIQNSLAQLDEVSKSRGADAERDLAGYREKQAKALVKAKPEWADAPKYEAAMAQASKYLTEVHGYTKEMIDQIEDHQIAITVWEASEYRRMKAAGSKKLSDTKKKGLKKPRALKGQARRDPSDPRLKQRNQTVLKLRETGDARAAASLIEEHL